VRRPRVTPSLLPGFGPALGVTLLGLSLVVLAPLSALLATSLRGSPRAFFEAVTTPRVVAALRLSFGLSAAAAAVSALLGLLVGWVLVRYRFPGRRLLDALVDLPFALPTAVAGITLTTLYAPNGWLGKPLAALGLTVAFRPLGIGVALVFLGIPFTVRTLQPVLASLDAPRLETFRRVLFPELLPSLLTGATLAFARGLGEYGSVVFISGNMPMKTEIAPLLVMTKLEQYDMAGATALATVLLVASFLLLLLLNRLEAWAARSAR
jgi:sulfate transport system permease protein